MPGDKVGGDMVRRVLGYVVGFYLLMAVVGRLLREWERCGAAARLIAGASDRS